MKMQRQLLLIMEKDILTIKTIVYLDIIRHTFLVNMLCTSRYLTPKEELKLLPKALYEGSIFLITLFINDMYLFIYGLNDMFHLRPINKNRKGLFE